MHDVDETVSTKNKEEKKENKEKRAPSPTCIHKQGSESEMDSLKKGLEERDAKIAELTDCLKRLQADFENYKKTVERRNREVIAAELRDFIKKMLPVLDSLELAVKNTSDKERLIRGIELVFAQLHSTLKEAGLEKINSVDERFDPNRHEALLVEETKDEDEDERIVEELQKGYLFRGAVIRTSKVKIKKKI